MLSRLSKRSREDLSRPVLFSRAMKDPLVVVVAGPNGAGKSTTAPRLLRGALAVTEFVNADAIAQGL